MAERTPEPVDTPEHLGHFMRVMKSNAERVNTVQRDRDERLSLKYTQECYDELEPRRQRARGMKKGSERW